MPQYEVEYTAVCDLDKMYDVKVDGKSGIHEYPLRSLCAVSKRIKELVDRGIPIESIEVFKITRSQLEWGLLEEVE